MKIRDVDKLDAVPDGKLKKQGADYLKKLSDMHHGIPVLQRFKEKHSLQELFAAIITKLITLKPMDPIQYMIDFVQYGEEYASQDGETGLPNHRKENLKKVFEKLMAPGGDGTPEQSHISFETFEGYVSKFGVATLDSSDMKSIFKSYDPRGRNMVTLNEFYSYFAKVSASIPNSEFENMVRELSGDFSLYQK